jgi:membrane protein
MATGARVADGGDAASPGQIPGRGWKDVLVRAFKASSEDSIGLVAAGVSFYVFLALVPLLGATVLTYGLVASIQSVNAHIARIVALLPGQSGQLIADQLVSVVQSSSSKKGIGLAIALAFALFGARNAAGSAINALNIAYEEEEKRGFLKLNLLALALTATAVVATVFAMLGIGAMSFLGLALPKASATARMFSHVVAYLILAVVGATAAALLYRFAPSRDEARWRWLTPGSILFAIAWVAPTLGFSIYVRRFGSYGATYGSLSAVVVLLTWLYLSAYALLFGAELNSELEHQTARDTTAGAERPLGQRNAWAADHVAEGS